MRKSIGIELTGNINSAILLQKEQAMYQPLAWHQAAQGDSVPEKLIEELIFSLNEQAPNIKLSKLPVHLALSSRFINQQTIVIEEEVLRLKPYVIDQYIFARALEYIQGRIRDFYVDYMLCRSKETDLEQASVLIIWVEKASIRPYLSKLKKLRLRPRVLESADMAKERFYTKQSAVLNITEAPEFIVCCGAALGEWENVI